MIPLLQRFFTTEAAAERVIRSLLLVAGTVQATGAEFTDWGAWLVGAAGLVKAGELNPEGKKK